MEHEETMENFTNARQLSQKEGLLYFLLNWERILLPWQQLCTLYFGLFLLAGCGGTIFWLTEYSTEQELLEARFEYLEKLKNVFTEGSEKYNRALEWGEVAHEFYYPTEENPDGVNRWELRYSAFFAATTFTTIGYGLQAPVTVVGRLMVGVYGLPAIFAYASLAKRVGEILISFFQSFFVHLFSKETYDTYKNTTLICIVSLCYFGLAYIIRLTADDEGFGNGIYTYFPDAIYFLMTTSLTIGYGDVMMSGDLYMTPVIGFWLTATLGMTLYLLTEIENATPIPLSRLSRQTQHKLSNTLLKIHSINTLATCQEGKGEDLNLREIDEIPLEENLDALREENIKHD